MHAAGGDEEDDIFLMPPNIAVKAARVCEGARARRDAAASESGLMFTSAARDDDF